MLKVGSRISIRLLCLVVVAILSACDGAPQSTATPEPTTTSTLALAATPTLEPTATHTPEPTATSTPAPTVTAAPEPTATSTPEPTATPTPEPTATPTPEPTNTSTPEPTATPTPEPTDTPTPEPLTSEQIFERVSPSVVFIETAARKGSGVLIEGGYVVTNAEVVWPFETVSIVFPDGSEFLEVSVKGLDFISDLAVLGPIDSPTIGVELADSETTEEGASVYVVGHAGQPAEVDQPLVESRLILGASDFGSSGITFMHTEAKLRSGGAFPSRYSGWVVVSEGGEVVGVLGRRPEGTPYEVSASSADILPRVRQLIAGEDPYKLGDRRIPFEGGELSHEINLEHFLAQRVYVINELPGTKIELVLTGEDEANLDVVDSRGRVKLVVPKNKTDAAAGSLIVENDEPHFVTVGQSLAGQGTLTLSSSHPLVYLQDMDDGRRVRAGDTVYGNIDFPGDIDYFVFDLSEGETVEIRKTSVVFDSHLKVRPLDRDGRVIFDPDDAGVIHKGGFSTYYQASETGRYIAVVNRASSDTPGGYVLEVETADPEVVLTQAARDSGSQDADATATTVPDSTAIARPESTAAPSAGTLTPAQILDKVSPSIAMVETAARQGSGVLIEGGYIVVNAQVVWPFDNVRVVFPDGSEFLEVPVKGLDVVADLAVIGPIDTPIGAIELVDGESLPDDTDAFLVGYPTGAGTIAELGITPRLLHHVIDFGNTGVSYLRTEAGIERSRIGWVVVSQTGDVIGVLGQHDERGFLDLAASSSDILPRAQQLIAGGDPSQLGDRRIPLKGAKLRHEVKLEHFLAQRVYVINELPGTEIEIEVTGDDEGKLAVKDSLGRAILASPKYEGDNLSGSLVIGSDEPHFLVVNRLVEGPADLTLIGSHRLIHLPDPDDGRRFEVGGSIRGNIDFPGDIDYFLFDLSEGETVELVLGSAAIDTFLNVYPMDSDGQIVFGVNGEVILFRSDAITVYRAPQTGTYSAVVARISQDAPAGYVVTANAASPELALTYTARAAGVREPEADSTPATEQTATPTPEPTATPTPTPTNTPMPTPTDAPPSGPLTFEEIFDRVAPSIVRIERAAVTGSGILIEGGYVLTTAHLVWPQDTMRVVFPDGSEFPEVPVVGIDLLVDIAVLGPIDTPKGALELVDGESLPIGSDTFLIGYAIGAGQYSEPTITQGRLARVAEVETVGMTYFLTDADSTTGQSGGALVSERGEIIGMYGYRLRDRTLGVAGSSADILPRVRQIIAGQDPSGLGDRTIPRKGGALRHEVELGHLWAQNSFVVDELPGTVIDIEFAGDNDAVLTVKDPLGGELANLTSDKSGVVSTTITIEYDGPHFLFVESRALSAGNFTVSSSHRLIHLHDPDDGTVIQAGGVVRGHIDFPEDYDFYFIDLSEGETIEIASSSILADTGLAIYYPGAGDAQMIIDDNGGGGLFGFDPKIVYRAPHTGRFTVLLIDSIRDAPGGYVITVEAADPDAELTQRTRADVIREANATPTPTTDSEFGLAELKSAFADLPDSFQELDPESTGISIESLGLKDVASSLVVFTNTEPVQVIIAASGELTDLLSIALDSVWSPDTVLDEIVQAQISEVLDSGKLQTVTVGDNSFGVYLETASERGPQRMELIMYRRGNLFGAIYSYTVAGTEPVVSVEELAMMLDTKMVDFLRTRDP